MEVERPADARAFLNRAGPLLTRHEARNNLILGIAGTIVERPDRYEEVHLWVVLDQEMPAAAALRTPPHNLVLADPDSERALEILLDAVAQDDVALPGVVGNEPNIDHAATVLARAQDRRAEPTLRQGVYELTDVRPVSRPPGAPRPTGPKDAALVRTWLEAFIREAFPEPEVHLEQLERSFDISQAPDHGMWLWEDDGEPVSVSAFGGPTTTGIRIGPVYTPPDHRRRGYATALVADISAWLLGRGHRACFLFTDLANPTSNRIYTEVGYTQVAEATEFRFR